MAASMLRGLAERPLQPAGALTHRLHHNYGDLNPTNDRSNAPGSLGQ
jgi:hypothetical protein